MPSIHRYSFPKEKRRVQKSKTIAPFILLKMKKSGKKEGENRVY